MPADPVGVPARDSTLPRLSTTAMFCGRRPGTAADTRFKMACTPSLSIRAAPAMVSSTDAWASCCSRANGSRRGSTKCTRTARTPAMLRDRAREFAFQRARLIEALLELVGGEAVAAIEDFIADGPAGRQAVFGQQQAQAGHLVAWRP